jgi:hypothetical protein
MGLSMQGWFADSHSAAQADAQHIKPTALRSAEQKGASMELAATVTTSTAATARGKSSAQPAHSNTPPAHQALQHTSSGKQA